MENIELQTEFECLVVTEEEQIFVSPANSLVLEKENFAVYPATKKVLPFVVSTSKRRGDNFCFWEQDGKTFCFLFTSGATGKVIERLKIEKEEVEILLSHQQIDLKSKTNSFCFDFAERAKKYKLASHGNFAIVQLFFSTCEQVIIFCPTTAVCNRYIGKNFEIQNDNITFVEEKKDFAKSTTVKQIVLEKEAIKEKVLSFEKAPFSIKNETVCFCFLDCIKNQNYLLAKELLSPSLQAVDEEQLKSFFQKQFKFFSLSPTEFAIVFPEEVKSLSFSVDNGKITDFEWK